MDGKLSKGDLAGNVDQLAVLGEGKRGLSNARGSTMLQEN